jgi:hypothetical protein
VAVPAEADGADNALAGLLTQLESVADELRRAHQRAQELQEQRRTGLGWYAIVSAEERPLIVEQVSSALSSLNTAGSRWRREQALALSREKVSINRIAALYGVTRQRASALLRDRPDAGTPGDAVE